MKRSLPNRLRPGQSNVRAGGRTTRFLFGAVGALVVGLCQSPPCWAQNGPKAAAQVLSLNSLSMEVGALQALDQFSFTKAQLEKLQQLAQGTAQKDSKRKAAKASEEYRDKLQALGAALARGKDRERIFKLHDELAALRQKEKPTFDDRVEMTEAAGKRAGEAFRMLKAGQLAFYIGQIAEDIADPVDRLIGSLQDVRTMSDEEWQEQRDDIADDISRMAAGPDQVKSKPIREQVSALLLRTRNLTKIDYEKQQPELDRSARKIIGDISPFDVLRHHVELDLAILLSNPRLPPALQARLAAPQK